MDTQDKLAILADAAKYDASCASSGAAPRDSAGETKGIGSAGGVGICHAYAPDGRCISLLKVLLTNFCIYDCRFCVNRNSSNVRRARFAPDELARLVMAFYRRNYIEGLFLSSGIIRSPDYTMEEIVRVARLLREEHAFRGYIHLKAIPNADPALLAEAGRYADRLSLNVELPTETGLERFAPEKDGTAIRQAMGRLRLKLEEARDERRRSPRAPRFASGQSTQMIVGADGAKDADILATSSRLYGSYHLKRVYYSAFSPIPDSSSDLPLKAPPLRRENRLYQADWLMRYYGFEASEIVGGSANGMLDLDVDPKLAWALAHRAAFPVDVNGAERELLLRVPGLGVRMVDRLIDARRFRRLRIEDLARMGVRAAKVSPFIEAEGYRPRLLDSTSLRERVAPKARQLSLFDRSLAA